VLIAENDQKDRLGAPSEWVLFSQNAEIFKAPGIEAIARDLRKTPGIRLWTDDYSNLFQVVLW
jgi:hypothetical protein